MKNLNKNMSRKAFRVIESLLATLYICISIVAFYALGQVILEFMNVSLKLTNFILFYKDNFIVLNSFYLFIFLLMMFINDSSLVNLTFLNSVINLSINALIASVSSFLLSLILMKGFFFSEVLVLILILQIIGVSILKILIQNVFYTNTIFTKVMLIGEINKNKRYYNKFFSKKMRGKKIQYIYDMKLFDLSKFRKYSKDINEIYIFPSVSTEVKDKIIKECISESNKSIFFVPELYEVGIDNKKIKSIDDVLFFKIKPFRLLLRDRFVKRAFDIIFSVAGFIIALPILSMVALLILIFDKGPLIYSQERVTLNNKKFMLYKFRTMNVDAEKISGPVWAAANDPRITRIGKFLRKTRLDELPQFVNVILGDMSFVGPRPEREALINKFIKDNPDFSHRINVKAGLTGFAQVYGKYNTSPNDKLRYDLYYISNYSFILDIKIILLTIKTIFDSESTSGVKMNSTNADFLNNMEIDVFE